MALELDSYPDIAYGTGTDRNLSGDERRQLWKWEAAIGYRIFAAMRWGQLGDGHITCRDPEHRDHFWMLSYGVPFHRATVRDLILIGPDGSVAEGPAHATANTAGYNIHHPLLEVRQDINSAAHTHTAFGTPWSANVEPFRAISQESCSFVFNQAMYEGEDLEVDSTDGGYRIAEAMGTNTLVILRNHGLLTGGLSPAEAVGWFVIAERVAEVHVKAPNGKAISDEMAKHIARSFEDPAMGWRTWQWLARDLVPDPTVVL
ncbi:MAG: class II aldolase/adducin family protein [Actinomycetota bacterium]